MMEYYTINTLDGAGQMKETSIKVPVRLFEIIRNALRKLSGDLSAMQVTVDACNLNLEFGILEKCEDGTTALKYKVIISPAPPPIIPSIPPPTEFKIPSGEIRENVDSATDDTPSKKVVSPDIKELLIQEYFKLGGEPFFIKRIDTIRDGGTDVIETFAPVQKYYIHKKNRTIHRTYPPTDENMITSPVLINYIMDRIDSYINELERQVRYNKQLLTTLTNQFNTIS